jgi:hypothetical protein
MRIAPRPLQYASLVVRRFGGAAVAIWRSPRLSHAAGGSLSPFSLAWDARLRTASRLSRYPDHWRRQSGRPCHPLPGFQGCSSGIAVSASRLGAHGNTHGTETRKWRARSSPPRVLNVRDDASHFYFLLPSEKVGCHPAPFWLGAAATTLTFFFLGFLGSRLLLC